jgi:hypothetical protein
MPSTPNADEMTGNEDAVLRVTRMCDQTILMAVDGTLRALPDESTPSPLRNTNTAAAAEVRELARRMLQATRDLGAMIREPAE